MLIVDKFLAIQLTSRHSTQKKMDSAANKSLSTYIALACVLKVFAFDSKNIKIRNVAVCTVDFAEKALSFRESSDKAL